MSISQVGYISGAILLTMTILSLCCSFFLIHVIIKMGKWNGFTRIIWSMTICQIVYDASFFFAMYSSTREEGYYSTTLVDIFLSSFGGISVTFFTNVLMVLVFYMVYKRKAVRIMENFRAYFATVVLTSIALAIYSTVAFAKGNEIISGDIYNYVRLLSILLNIFVYAIVTKILWTPTYQPLLVLSSRLKYYPICQVVTRLWPTIYEFIYGYSNEIPADFWHSFGFYLYCLFLPSAGVGYFFVFLVMQPQAHEKFLALFSKCKCPSKESTPTKVFSSNSRSSGSILQSDIGESIVDRMLPSYGDMDEDELAMAIDRLNDENISTMLDRGSGTTLSVDNTA